MSACKPLRIALHPDESEGPRANLIASAAGDWNWKTVKALNRRGALVAMVESDPDIWIRWRPASLMAGFRHGGASRRVPTMGQQVLDLRYRPGDPRRCTVEISELALEQHVAGRVIKHEIGHALGLGHPAPNRGGGIMEADLTEPVMITRRDRLDAWKLRCLGIVGYIERGGVA